MALDGTPLGGWSQYSLSPTNAAWIGWMYYQHWLYTADDVFLRTRAYPWCSEIGRSLLDLLEPDAEGTLRLPLSSSPEVHDNSLDAWLEPNSNYDSACMEALFLALSAMARAMGEADQAASWRVAADGLGSPVIEPGTGCLMFAQGEPVRESHRHLSHSMAIHPFGLIHVEAGEDQRRIIEATNARYDELGTQAWVGYSFSWMSCLRARAGEPEAALDNLEIFVRAFVLRNGFHVNGDQTRSGYSGFTYRPFTLEGNFLAAQAVHEMLLQSWSTDPSDPSSSVIRIFPSMPESWADASFADLRAEGGHRVSARREEGRTTWVRVAAGSDGRVRIRDCFGGAGEWSVPMTRDGDDLVVELAMGESVEGWST
jgi:alpha-L-fucosidase 2